MKRAWWLGMILFLLAGVAPGQSQALDVKDTWAQARAAYDQGEYPSAMQLYQGLLEAGVDQAEVYYNLGNAAFKNGQIGRAVAAYRSALKRAPGDEDIQHNLRHAKSLVRQPADPKGPLMRSLEKTLTRFSSQELTLAAWLLYAAFAAVLGVLLLRRGQGLLWRWLAAGTGFLFLLAAGWASFRIMDERSAAWGVVVASQAEARNGPGEEYQVGFTVPEGREVRVLGREREWMAIGLAIEGYKGWVKASEVLEDR